MKIKPGFILRRMGDECVAVAVGEAGKSFNGMIRLNAAGGFLWDQLKEGISRDALIQKMLERYEGLSEDRARADLAEFLDSISLALDD